MPPTKVNENQLLNRLSNVFRRHGYEGASLSLITKATGLKRASLYHRFPEGKEQMALAVLSNTDDRFINDILAPLSEEGDPAKRVKMMAQRLDKFYNSGRQSCLLDTLSLGDATNDIHKHVKQSFNAWLNAMAKIAKESGASPAAASHRAANALVRIQGAVVFARATGDNTPFKRTLAALPEILTQKT